MMSPTSPDDEKLAGDPSLDAPPSEPPDPPPPLLSPSLWSASPHNHGVDPLGFSCTSTLPLAMAPSRISNLGSDLLLPTAVKAPTSSSPPLLAASLSSSMAPPLGLLRSVSRPLRRMFPPTHTSRHSSPTHQLGCLLLPQFTLIAKPQPSPPSDPSMQVLLLTPQQLKTKNIPEPRWLRTPSLVQVLVEFMDLSTAEIEFTEGFSLTSFSSCMRSFAALCRMFLCFNSLQPLVYLPSYLYFESLMRPDLHVAWVSALIVSTSAMERSVYSIRFWWCLLVVLPPKPPVPPDPPDYIIAQLWPFDLWTLDSAILTLSSLGDMSFLIAFISTVSILPVTQAARLVLSIFLPLYEDPLPLYEDHLPLYEDPLPLYEDHLPLYEDPLPLYEDRSTLSLYEEFVTLPLYEDLGSFMEFVTLLCSLLLNGCVTRGVIKGSFDRCLYASVAILEIGNRALVAVPISGVRSSAQGVILLNNSIVEEIRGILEDFYLFKCYVAIILLCLSVSFVVVSSFCAMMAMLFENTCSVFGD